MTDAMSFATLVVAMGVAIELGVEPLYVCGWALLQYDAG